MIQSRVRRNLERMRTEPGLGKNVTVFAVLIALALVAGGWVLSNQRFTAPWTDRVVLNAEFEAVPGIAPGNGQEVRIAGILVGQITGAEVNDEGRAQLRMELEPGHEVYDNARLTLRPKSPLNEMYVTIEPGGPPGELLADGATLPVTNTVRPIQVDEVLGNLDDGARRALTALLRESDVAMAKAPEVLPEGLDATTSLMQRLEPVVTQLETRRAALARLVTSLSRVSEVVGEDEERLVALAGDLQTTLAAVSAEDEALEASLGQLPDLTSRLGSSTAAVRELSEELAPTLREVQAATGDLPEAFRRLTRTAETLQETVEVARPVLANAKPVVADLRPVAQRANVALPALRGVTTRLDPVTATLLQYLPDVAAFFVNTRSLTSLRDGNGGVLRGMLEITSTTFPTDDLSFLSPDEPEGPLGPGN